MANEIAVASIAFEVYLIISAGVGALAQYLHGGEPVPPEDDPVRPVSSRPDQYAPLPRSTAPAVFQMIAMSMANDQFST